MAVGYLWVFKFLTCLDSGPQTIKAWEERWPFKNYKEDPCFFATQSQSSLANDPAANRAASASTGASTGGASSGGSMFSSFMGGGNSSSTSTLGGAGAGSGAK